MHEYVRWAHLRRITPTRAARAAGVRPRTRPVRRLAPLLTLLLVAGCGVSPAPSTPAGGTTPADPGASGPGVALPSDAGAGAPSLGPIASSSPALDGTVTYVRDTAKSVFATIDGDTEGDTVLSTQDAGGRTWTLTIPAGAVQDEVTLAMTPLTEITPTGLPGPIAGGVSLDPEDVQFLAPATLTVDPGDGKSAAILTGTPDGRASLVPPSSESLDGVAVTHFSPWYWIDPDDPYWTPYADKVFKDGNAALAEAAALLATPINVPQPPSIPYGCTDDKAKEAAGAAEDAYIEALRAPEVYLIDRLLAAEKMRALTSADRTTWHASILQLSDRMVKKDMAVLKAVKPRLEVLYPVLLATMGSGREAGLTGSDIGPLTDAISAWALAGLDSVVESIAKDHDFRQYPDLLRVLKTASLLSSGAPGWSDFLDRLKRAMRFEARLTWNFSSPDSERWVIKGTIPMTWPGFISVKGVPFVQGSAEVSDVVFSNGVQGLTLQWQPFTAKAGLLDLDVCEGTAFVGVDTFSLAKETYLDTDGNAVGLPRTWIAWEWVDLEYSSAITGSDTILYYGTPATLKNGSATWVDETVEDSEGGWSSTFQFQVVHTGT